MESHFVIFYNWHNFYFPARSFANMLGIKNAKVYRISGFTKVDEYDIVEGEEVRQKSEEPESELVTEN